MGFSAPFDSYHALLHWENANLREAVLEYPCKRGKDRGADPGLLFQVMLPFCAPSRVVSFL